MVIIFYFLGKDFWALKKLSLSIEESANNCKKCVDLSCVKMCDKSINIPENILKINRLIKYHVNGRFIM